MSRRHMFIPDPQIEPGVCTDQIDWAAEALVEYRPDVVVVAGDWWTMPSLSSFDRPGSKKMEGARLNEDIWVGNEAFDRFVEPMEIERDRRRRNHRPRWEPELHFLMGNHENRINRAIANEPKYEGMLSTDLLRTPGFDRHDFLEIVDIDGVSYSHYFANTHSNKPIGGSIDNRLNKIGRTFVQGHEQGLLYGIRQFPGNITRHGVVAGSFYLHDEVYRGPQGNGEWRGIVVLNEVEDGNFDVMPLSINYLRDRFGAI